MSDNAPAEPEGQPDPDGPGYAGRLRRNRPPITLDFDNLPAEFTAEIVGRMTNQQAMAIERYPLLTPQQRESFNAATKELFAPISSSLAKLRVTPPMAGEIADVSSRFLKAFGGVEAPAIKAALTKAEFPALKAMIGMKPAVSTKFSRGFPTPVRPVVPPGTFSRAFSDDRPPLPTMGPPPQLTLMRELAGQQAERDQLLIERIESLEARVDGLVELGRLQTEIQRDLAEAQREQAEILRTQQVQQDATDHRQAIQSWVLGVIGVAAVVTPLADKLGAVLSIGLTVAFAVCWFWVAPGRGRRRP